LLCLVESYVGLALATSLCHLLLWCSSIENPSIHPCEIDHPNLHCRIQKHNPIKYMMWRDFHIDTIKKCDFLEGPTWLKCPH
jgi:hypothetical protein